MLSLSRLLTGLLACLCLILAAGATPNIDKLRDSMTKGYGTESLAFFDAWQRMLTASASLPIEQQLKQVNDFFNQHIRYSEDRDLWQQSDYWATPLQTLGVRAGDCEDYTIAKYMSLKQLGVPIEKLRLIYVRAQLGGPHSQVSQAHMVLGYYETPRSLPLVLDNMVTQIQPANQRPDLQPVFSFNSQGLWVGNSTQSQADPHARLSRWRDLLARMQADGFYD